MGSTLESGVVVEAGAAVAPGSVVAAGTSVTAGQLFSGSPAKALRPLTAEESSRLLAAASSLPSLAKVHKAENLKTFIEVSVALPSLHRVCPSGFLPVALSREIKGDVGDRAGAGGRRLEGWRCDAVESNCGGRGWRRGEGNQGSLLCQ
jgi:hypothetical protein